MRYIILLLLLALPVQSTAADLIIRTKASKTLRQAALEIKAYISKSHVLLNGDPDGKIEDMLGDVMTPPIKSLVTAPTNRWYTRIRVPQSDVAAITSALPSATTVELVCWDCGGYELDPGVWVGGIL